MAMLNYIYILGILGVIFLYAFVHVNAVWLIGYLVILLIANLMPKKLKWEIILGGGFIAGAAGAAFAGQSAIGSLVAAFSLLATGLPGTLLYAGVTLVLHSYSAVQAITLVSGEILLIIVVIQVVRLFLTKVLFVTFWIPILDIIPIIIDAALIVAMVYLTIGTGNGSVLYNTIQSGVNAFI